MKVISKIYIVIISGLAICFYFADFNLSITMPILTLLAISFHTNFRFRLNPVITPALVFLFTGLVGRIASENKNSSIGTSFNLILSSELRDKTLSIFCLAGIFIIFGSIFTLGRNVTQVNIREIIPEKLSNRFALISIFPLIGILIGFTTSQFFYRENHLLDLQIPLLARFSFTTSLLAVFTIAIWSNAQDAKKKAYGLFIIGSYGTIYFAMSSRALAIIPFAIAIAIINRFTIGKAIISAILVPFSTFIGLAIPLYLRSLPEEGLIPYLKSLQFVAFGQVSTRTVFQNFIVSFDLNGLTAFSISKLPLRDLIIEISPIFGQAAGWYDISRNHRFNSATPFAGLGEIMNYGFIYFLVVFTLIGAVIGGLNFYLSAKIWGLGKISIFILMAGTSYFALLCLQYNFRSAIRVIYYLMAYVIAIGIMSRFLRIPRYK